MPPKRPAFEATLTRRFAAPLALVYRMWTEARHLERVQFRDGKVRSSELIYDARQFPAMD